MGGSKCCYPGCKNNSQKRKDISWFRITKERLNWIDILKLDKLRGKTEKQIQEHKICAEHFKAADFNNIRRDKLIYNAIPQISSAEEVDPDELPEDDQQGPQNGGSLLCTGAAQLQVPCPSPGSVSIQDVANSSPVDGTGVDAIELNCEEFSFVDDMEGDAPTIDQLEPSVFMPENHDILERLTQGCGPPDHNYSHKSNAQSRDDQVFTFAAPPQAQQQRKSQFTPLPRIPKVPVSERTPLVQAVITAAVRCRARAQRLQTQLKQKNSNIRKIRRDAEEVVMQKFKKKLDPTFFKILENNLQNADRKPKGRRYPLDLKVILFGLRKKGPRCFNSLPFIKPTRQTLRKVTKTLNFSPGQSEVLLKGVSARVTHMSLQERQVIIMFDEMTIRVHYAYDPALDKVKGFVDFGNGRRCNQTAEEAFNVMVRSIYGNWKQPIAFYFTHRKCTAEDFKVIIDESDKAVKGTGLIVRATCTDAMQKNKTAMDLMGASSEEPWFIHEDQKIYTLYDPPHYFKSMRNAQLNYDLKQADGSVVRKAYVDQVVRADMKTQPRLLKKITERHLTPTNYEKMSVPLFAELYSRKVAAAVSTYTTLGALPPEAMVTARFWELINDFFDSFNGTQESPPDEFHKYLCAVTPETCHFELWIKMYEEIQGWQFIGGTNLKFPERMQMTMRAMANLVIDLTTEGHGPVPVGHANNDGLENFHSCVRGALGHGSNPSAQEYPGAFCTCTVNIMTNKVKGKNCRDDNALNLIGLNALIKIADEEAKAKLRNQCAMGEDDMLQHLLESLDETFEEDLDEDADDPNEEDEEQTEDPFPLSTDEDFLQRLNAKMAAAQSSLIAGPIINLYLKSVNHCQDCTEILLGDSQFPLHILQTFSAVESIFSSQLPSAAICSLITFIYKKMEAHSPHHLHEENIIQNFVAKMKKEVSVQNFNLCPLHVEHKTALLKRISIGALNDVLLALNQTYKEKKKQKEAKKNKKTQRLQHL